MDHPNTRQKDSVKWKRAPFENCILDFEKLMEVILVLPLRIMAGFFRNKICTVGRTIQKWLKFELSSRFDLFFGCKNLKKFHVYTTILVLVIVCVGLRFWIPYHISWYLPIL